MIKMYGLLLRGDYKGPYPEGMDLKLTAYSITAQALRLGWHYRRDRLSKQSACIQANPPAKH